MIHFWYKLKLMTLHILHVKVSSYQVTSSHCWVQYDFCGFSKTSKKFVLNFRKITKNDSFLQFYLVAQLKTSKFIYFVGHTLVADTSNEITLWCFFRKLKIYICYFKNNKNSDSFCDDMMISWFLYISLEFKNFMEFPRSNSIKATKWADGSFRVKTCKKKIVISLTKITILTSESVLFFAKTLKRKNELSVEKFHWNCNV